MKKKLCSIILALILLIQPAFSLAQTSQPPDTQSDVCGAPGETMLLYQKFQRDISSALLGGVLGEKIFQTEFSVRGLFTSETLRLPTTGNNALDTVISTLRNNSRRLGSATVTTTVLLALAGASVVSSNLEGFAILFQNRAIVRDWRSLLQIETRISQIAYSLGKRANLIGTLNEDGGALQAIVQQYVNEGLFTGEVRTDKTTYSAILTSLTRMNAGMKMFLSFRNTSFLSNFGTFYGAKFNPEALANLKKEYTGARWPMDCSVMSKRIWSRLKNATSMVGNGAKEAGKTIADASVRLFKALFKGSSLKEGVKREGIAEKYFDKYELQQLRTIYGLDTSKMTETTAKGRRRIITPTTSTKRAMNDIAKKTVSLVESSVKSSVNGVVAVINTSKEYIENLHSREWNPKYRAKGKPATDEATFANLHFTESEKRQIIAKLGGSYNENFNEGLHLAFTDSVNEAEKLFNRMTTDFIIAENTSQTSQFSSIVQQIEALETVIKDGTDNIPPLLKILGDICEYQCENKGTKGCRPG